MLDLLDLPIEINCTVEVELCQNFTDVGNSFSESLFVYGKVPNMILISSYIPLFLLAFVSNFVVIIVVSRYRKLRSVTNYFLVNLSVADLLVTLICMPMSVGQAIYSLWLYGDFMCKITHFLQGVSVTASIFTITAMSIDRYIAIRHPMSRKIINRRSTRKVIVFIWLLAILIFSPILFIRKTEGFRFGWDTKEFIYCTESWPNKTSQMVFGIFVFVVIYLIPGVIVVVAYSLMGLRLCSRQLLPEYELNPGTSTNTPRSGDSNQTQTSTCTATAWQVSAVGGRLIWERRRVAKILLILAVVFAFCWLPYCVLVLILDMNPTENDVDSEVDIDEKLTFIVELLLPFAILLGHSQAAANPLLYFLLSKNFRRTVLDLIRHPRRAPIARQPCKIRIIFRKTPASSSEPPSSEKPPSMRPRNHHAPEPPSPSSSQSNNVGVLLRPGDIPMVELGQPLEQGVERNPPLQIPSPPRSSSGYSSQRLSESTSSCQHCAHVLHCQTFSTSSNQDVTLLGTCGYCSLTNCSYRPFPSVKPSHDQNQGLLRYSSLLFGKRRLSATDCRRVTVPSTIKEESENSSNPSSRKSNSSSRLHVNFKKGYSH